MSLGSNTGLILLVIILVLAVSFFFALVVDYPLKVFFFFFDLTLSSLCFTILSATYVVLLNASFHGITRI